MLPSANDPYTPLVSQSTWNAVTRVFDEQGITSSKKTHGGRHSGSIEGQRIGIVKSDIKEGGRWCAERGRMESFYLSALPTNFAVGMAGFLNRPFALIRNAVDPPLELQRLIFPWIETAYGENNTHWLLECEKEMNEIDPNFVPSMAEEAKQSQRPNEPPFKRRTDENMAYSEADIAKSGFLRLLLRCRRIVLQDAAFRLYYNQPTRLLLDKIFQSPLFVAFCDAMKGVVDASLVQKDPLEQHRAAVPAIANAIRDGNAHQQTDNQAVQARLGRIETMLEQSLEQTLLQKQSEQREKEEQQLQSKQQKERMDEQQSQSEQRFLLQQLQLQAQRQELAHQRQTVVLMQIQQQLCQLDPDLAPEVPQLQQLLTKQLTRLQLQPQKQQELMRFVSAQATPSPAQRLPGFGGSSRPAVGVSSFSGSGSGSGSMSVQAPLVGPSVNQHLSPASTLVEGATTDSTSNAPIRNIKEPKTKKFVFKVYNPKK